MSPLKWCWELNSEVHIPNHRTVSSSRLLFYGICGGQRTTCRNKRCPTMWYHRVIWGHQVYRQYSPIRFGSPMLNFLRECWVPNSALGLFNETFTSSATLPAHFPVAFVDGSFLSYETTSACLGFSGMLCNPGAHDSESHSLLPLGQPLSAP